MRRERGVEAAHLHSLATSVLDGDPRPGPLIRPASPSPRHSRRRRRSGRRSSIPFATGCGNRVDGWRRSRDSSPSCRWKPPAGILDSQEQSAVAELVPWTRSWTTSPMRRSWRLRRVYCAQEGHTTAGKVVIRAARPGPLPFPPGLARARADEPERLVAAGAGLRVRPSSAFLCAEGRQLEGSRCTWTSSSYASTIRACPTAGASGRAAPGRVVNIGGGVGSRAALR